jgi:uncharacterized protein
MRSYERSGVTIDQCADCRGIFLDRGELEHLIDADARFQAGSAPTPAPPSRDYDRDYDKRRDDRRDDRYDDRHDSYGSKPRKKKRSIFEELFD